MENNLIKNIKENIRISKDILSSSTDKKEQRNWNNNIRILEKDLKHETQTNLNFKINDYNLKKEMEKGKQDFNKHMENVNKKKQ